MDSHDKNKIFIRLYLGNSYFENMESLHWKATLSME